MGSISRKDFLKNVLYSGAILMGGGAILSACTTQKKPISPEAANDPCTNVNNLSQADLETRTQFAYTGHTPNTDKYCSNCLHWRPPAGSGPCGTCELVKGPINPNGYCTQWMQKPKSVG